MRSCSAPHTPSRVALFLWSIAERRCPLFGMYVTPFARQGHWTVFDNALVDTLLPHLPASSWAVLTVVLRQTSGWQREAVAATHRDLAASTGLSERTVASALVPLTDASALPGDVVDPRGGAVLLSNAPERARTEPLAYRLNPSFRLLRASVRRLRSGGDIDAPVALYSRPGVGEAEPVCTAIFATLGTAIFARHYESIVEATSSSSGAALRGGPMASPLGSFHEVVEALATGCERLSQRGQIMALVAAARELYGPAAVPTGREAHVEAGKLRQFAGSGGAALRLLLMNAPAQVRTNPFRYAMATGAGERRDAARARREGEAQRRLASGPEHLGLYDLPTVRTFVAEGVDRSCFKGGPRTATGEQTYRYLDPAIAAPDALNSSATLHDRDA